MRGLAKGPYQKNTPAAVRFEPANVRVQIQALYQLSYTASPLVFN